jgi:hypothetical protein
MFTFGIYCFVNGRLRWMVESVKGFPTRAAAIDGARLQAKNAVPLMAKHYEETESGARIWYTNESGERVFQSYSVI